MRTSITYPINSLDSFKAKLLNWAQQFTHCVWLDSNNHHGKYSAYDAILAVDAHSLICTDSENAFDQLQEYLNAIQDWSFGYFTYDLKNYLEDLHSKNFDGLDFPELFFFQPKKLFLFKDGKVEFNYINGSETDIETDFQAIKSCSVGGKILKPNPKIKMRIHKEAYFKKVDQLLDRIHRGDLYEANFCQEFYAEDICLDPTTTFRSLNRISQSPFSSYLKLDDKYLLSASPERFVKKEGSTLVSQPIKGTAKRSNDDQEDKRLKEVLKNDEKERSENIMIVDLVRNDLSRHALPGTVKVTELCEVYSFLQVHQMISTIESKLQPNLDAIDAITQAFPMGSMTGAPKISAMTIIEELEETKRGLYSGSVGYFKPNGDFDFNVVIRSILYNAQKKYASFSVGSAITAKSDPQAEYEECLLKAKAMREVLEN